MGCRARVWDNGDMTDCGDAVLRANRCAAHIHDEVESLIDAIKDYEKKIKECRDRIAVLQTESG